MMQAATVLQAGPLPGKLQWPAFRLQSERTRTFQRKRSCAVVAATSGSGGPPKSDSFSGRDFLAEFDELFKSKPADKEPPKSSLSSLFDRKPDAGGRGLDFGIFRSSEPKQEKVKKPKINKKFFQSSPGKIEVKDIVEAFKTNENDVGSSPVQIALLSQRIKYVGAHLTEHPKDFSSRRGLKAMVEARKRHMLYLRKKDFDTYRSVIARLGLKDNVIKKAVKLGRSQ